MSAGLPGFLRRSLRSVDDSSIAFENDRNKADSVGSCASKSLIPKTRIEPLKITINDNSNEKLHTHIDRLAENESSFITEENDFVDLKFRMSTTSLTFDRTIEHVKSTEQIEKHSKIETAALWEPKAINSISNKDSNQRPIKNETFFHSDVSSKKSYKVIEFEKVITMPVVDIESLRKLSWNGIPVSITIFS